MKVVFGKEFWSRSSCLPARRAGDGRVGRLEGGSSPSGCCSWTGCGRPRGVTFRSWMGRGAGWSLTYIVARQNMVAHTPERVPTWDHSIANGVTLGQALAPQHSCLYAP